MKLLKLWLNRYKFYFLILITTFLFACNYTAIVSSKNLSERAKSAAAFVDSIGVAVHLDYGDTAYKNYNKIIKPRLEELGINHIRGSVRLSDLKTQAKLNDLAKIGIKSTIVMNPRRLSSPQDGVEIAKAIANSIEAVEGPNEWDIHPKFEYRGQSFPEGVRAFQSELYRAIKADPNTANLNVLGPAMARPENTSKLGTVACNLANMHSYAGGREPTWRLDNRWIGQTKIMCNSDYIIATESGYHNALNKTTKHQSAVSEQAAAKYLSRLFFEYFNRSEIKRAYTYELIDIKPNPELDKPTWHYGLLRNDGSPKPDFIALRNTIALLKDSGNINNFNPQSLEYSLTGDTTNIDRTLLQKKNGNFYLILWQEVTSFDLEKQQDIVVPSRSLKLDINTNINSAKIYEPINSIAAIAQYKNPKQLNIQVPDHPLIIELIP